MNLALDLSAAQRQIELDTGNPDAKVWMRLIHDREDRVLTPHPYGSVAELWPQIEAAQTEGFGVFVVVNEGGNDDASITRIRSLFIDADDIPLPDDWHVEPDFIVNRDATHWHAYWRIRGLPVAEFKQAQHRLAAHYGTDPAVCNPSRVMRLAGTLHLKADPKLVTLADPAPDREGWELGRTADELLAGLPELDTGSERAPSPATGEPISLDDLRTVLSYLDPNEPRADWLKHLGSLRAAPVPDDPDETFRRELAHAWSAGELDKLGRYASAPPSRYTDAAAVDRAFDTMPPKEGGAGVGSLIAAAREAGFNGLLGPTTTQLFGPVVTALSKTAGMVTIYTLTDHLRQEIGCVPELEPAWVERGTAHQLSAPGGKHKSRFLLQTGLGLASGKGMLGNRQHDPVPFVFYSYEDHPDEVARRVQAIVRRLGIGGADFRHIDLYGRNLPMLIVPERSEITVTEFGRAQLDYLRAIPGHKFVGLDGLYNAVRFEGKAKIAEDPVIAALGWLETLCAEANATVGYIFHPTYAGQARGDASGFSIAFNNFPRVRIQLASVSEDNDDTITLSMPKRNHGPRAKPLTLHWSAGALLPRAGIGRDDYAAKFRAVCVEVAITAAETDQPIQKQRRPAKWVFDEIERRTGRKPTLTELKDELAAAQRDRQLRYLDGSKHRSAGYYPFDPEKAAELAREAKHRVAPEASEAADA